ncbi:hypothetical protein BATDEDRAFT_16966 [Batrachochytrium dendrobatidis JAM81]|uniref:Bystin n=2 Tax=Batrachochytrium dendrobatidis TaxID=109871 RepID=F4P5H4_BATDJ|nr:snoRNA-binding rRNA-processing protein ENP1 [Batrachochytrium dendrobatidis JAM81]EGF79190.1 hypothetical protein BATDEDRAFT_16966 [Batrachochytrium dendrobatidis JAM81]|eukprot:XP_006679818.1 hypothetical protein BATDEDRAFT_16966 [Batrachochytrium dendrobatidis JAM81]
MVRSQQDEIYREDALANSSEHTYSDASAKKISKYAAIKEQRRKQKDESDDEQEDDENELAEGDYEDFEHDESDLRIDAGDEKLMEKFMNKETKKQINLSDLIMSKIQATNDTMAQDQETRNEIPRLNPKVVEVYTKVGILLSRYRSGPLPKPFKIIPTLRDWEEVLYITKPDQWTPHAMYQATRIFVSNLKSKMAQRFFSLILMDRIRDEIQETKKLNYHLYMAIKKALYKPAAFFKGFLLPICESGTCTLREAAILGSVLIKVSVPSLHAAAALLKIAEMEYTGPNSLFIRILLDKKYALPFKVIDSLVFHFLRFKRDQRELPVLWHQALLTFSQRYKEDLTGDQKEALLDLIKHKSHESITPEIRHELQNSVCRGESKDIPEEDIEMGVEF